MLPRAPNSQKPPSPFPFLFFFRRRNPKTLADQNPKPKIPAKRRRPPSPPHAHLLLPFHHLLLLRAFFFDRKPPNTTNVQPDNLQRPPAIAHTLSNLTRHRSHSPITPCPSRASLAVNQPPPRTPLNPKFDLYIYGGETKGRGHGLNCGNHS